jgi:serine/threonine-protein kinase
MSTDKKYERFGKYLVLDHLVDGGMAKISRARFLGEQANRLVAIKMVQAQFSKDPDFVRMFEDELKVCFALIHPNIAQTYDYGIWNGQLYTAMELIEGANLKEYLDRLTEKKLVFPVEISTYIISQVCQGLHYAHTFVDKLSGKPMNIVHRDISPHNIMLSFDGSVKVIDFGIAKAESNSEKTQAGTIKGKLSYLAPEYLEGLNLNHQYDQFAVGITLWELLCNRKLFVSKNDLAVLKLIQACKVPPPSSINPNVPKELDEIVLKALSKDRSQRFEDMDKFNRALVRFLYANYPEFNATDLQFFAHELFKEEITTNQKKYVDYGKIDIGPYLKELKSELDGTAPAAQSSGGETVQIQPPKSQEFEFDADELGGLGIDGVVDSTVEKTASTVKRPVNATVSNRRVVAKNQTRSQTSIRNPNIKTSGTRTNIKRVELQKKNKSQTPVGLLIVASIAAVTYFKFDLVQEFIGLTPESNQQVQRSVSSTSDSQVKSNLKSGKIVFKGLDPYMEITFNGSKLRNSGSEYSVSIGEPVLIRVEKKGYLPFTKQVQLSDSKSYLEIEIPEFEVARIGLLSTSMNYNGYKMQLFVNGQKIEKSLPVMNMRIPAGNYEAVLTNDLLGTEKKVEFIIEENKKFFLD